jgi:hypothetical protein
MTMTMMGLEADAIWVIMIVSVVVALFGLCRATYLEHGRHQERGLVRRI